MNEEGKAISAIASSGSHRCRHWLTSWGRLLLTLALVVLAAAILVIWHPTKDAGAWWLVGATSGLALLTGLLASATFGSVRQASRTAAAAEADLQQGIDLVKIGQKQVFEAQRQADLAQRALEAERQPVLLPTSEYEQSNPERMVQYFHGAVRSRSHQEFPVILATADETGGWVILKIRNVGRGPAAIGRDSKDMHLEIDGGVQIHGVCQSRVLAPDDRITVTFNEGPFGDDPQCVESFAGSRSPKQFTIVVCYSDISYQRRFRGRFTFDSARPHPMLVDATVEDLNLSLPEVTTT